MPIQHNSTRKQDDERILKNARTAQLSKTEEVWCGGCSSWIKVEDLISENSTDYIYFKCPNKAEIHINYFTPFLLNIKR